MLRYPILMAIWTLPTMLLPTTPTRRPCLTAASTTCWIREIREAKVATITRPGAWPMTRSMVMLTTCSEGV